MGYTPIPASWLEHLFVCDGCEKMSTKDWSKKGPAGHLCQRCYIKTEGYSTIQREGEK